MQSHQAPESESKQETTLTEPESESKQETTLTEEDYVQFIKGQADADGPDAAWQVYLGIPDALKNTSWKIHESILTMVCFYTDKTKKKPLLDYANRAYINALNADLKVSYDQVHQLMLDIALNYRLVDDYADYILETANESPAEKKPGELTRAAYQACVSMRKTLGAPGNGHQVWRNPGQLVQGLPRHLELQDDILHPEPEHYPAQSQAYYTTLNPHTTFSSTQTTSTTTLAPTMTEQAPQGKPPARRRDSA
ncbi:MAG TPA: hypothetical protein VLJ15_02790 [Gammaproteobacteria bacterium]|nr:hypothetical protein [Gammaproteobacteria bacterium]